MIYALPPVFFFGISDNLLTFFGFFSVGRAFFSIFFFYINLLQANF